MAASGKHVKNKNLTGKACKEAFTLEEVKYFGGNETDYEMLIDEDKGNTVNSNIKEKIVEIPETELKKFLDNLGIQKYSNVNENDTSVTTEKNIEDKKNSIKSRKILHKEPIKTSTPANKSISFEKSREKKSEKKFKTSQKVVEAKLALAVDKLLDKANQLFNNYSPRQKVLIQPSNKKWYENEFASTMVSNENITGAALLSFRKYSIKLLKDDVALSKNSKKQEKGEGHQNKWLQTAIKSGTLSDKTAALAVLIQNDPIHNLDSLDILLTMCKKKGRRESLLALDTLKQLWQLYLLPDSRKLLKFSQNDFWKLEEKASRNRNTRDKMLVFWHFEDQLKKKFDIFVQTLKNMLHDTLEVVKLKALQIVYDLLVNKPEQEKVLLKELLNKMGDPESKVASKALHLSTKLVEKHAKMKIIVALEIEELLYRPHIGRKLRYYAICFLNQFSLSHEEENVATELVKIYFTLFNIFIKKTEIDNKILSVLLTGVNRAYVYAKVDDEKVNKQINSLFSVVHLSSFNTAIQALMLLKHVVDSRQSMLDRYFVVLYRKMLDSELRETPRQAMFLNLLYRSMKTDNSLTRIKAFIKRLLQVCMNHNPNFTCGALYLISQIFQQHPVLKMFRHLEKNPYENRPLEELKTVDEPPKIIIDKNEKSYNPFLRNPLHSFSEKTFYWELRALSAHYHPSVSHFASLLLNGNSIHYTGSPLNDFTITRFLDRFVYKNPKKKERVSIMQPKTALYNQIGIRSIPVNSEHFLKEPEDKIPLDEVFFHRYFAHKKSHHSISKLNKDDIDDDDDSDNEDDASEISSIEDEELDEYLNEIEDKEADVDSDNDNDVDFFASNFSKKSLSKKVSDSKEDDDFDSSSSFDNDSDIFEESDEDFNKEEFGSGKSKMKVKKVNKSLNQQRKFAKVKKLSRNVKGNSGLNVMAQEFGHLIDENIGAKIDSTGLHALSNKDKADVKQLNWEVKRNQWLTGTGVHRKRKKNVKKFQTKRKKYI